jgi:hypothetical protein
MANHGLRLKSSSSSLLASAHFFYLQITAKIIFNHRRGTGVHYTSDDNIVLSPLIYRNNAKLPFFYNLLLLFIVRICAQSGVVHKAG